MPLFRSILQGIPVERGRHALLVSSCRPDFREEIGVHLGPPSGCRSGRRGRLRPLMAACDFASSPSGTASLELAWYGKPMMVLYRVPRYAQVGFASSG